MKIFFIVVSTVDGSKDSIGFDEANIFPQLR